MGLFKLSIQTKDFNAIINTQSLCIKSNDSPAFVSLKCGNKHHVYQWQVTREHKEKLWIDIRAHSLLQGQDLHLIQKVKLSQDYITTADKELRKLLPEGYTLKSLVFPLLRRLTMNYSLFLPPFWVLFLFLMEFHIYSSVVGRATWNISRLTVEQMFLRILINFSL